jgi:ADP-ribosylglycohydrolase
MDISMRDRFLGCIYGLAIGDALGYPVEFMRLAEIKSILGPDGVTGFDSLEPLKLHGKLKHPIGSYSDDTQMTLATANGIINSKSNEIDDLMDSISREYVKWYHDPENNRAPGNTCMAGAQNPANGVHWHLSGVEGSGCGAAMRTAPIGLFYADHLRYVGPLAYPASRCTHKDETAISAGVATAFLVNLACRESDPDYMGMRAGNFWGNGNPEFKAKIVEMNGYVSSESDPEVALKQLGGGWTGKEAVAMALYCFLKHPRDYKKAVLLATNIDGDSDSVASIVGAISGAYNGVQVIPGKWIDRIENKDGLARTAELLLGRALTVVER